MADHDNTRAVHDGDDPAGNAFAGTDRIVVIKITRHVDLGGRPVFRRFSWQPFVFSFTRKRLAVPHSPPATVSRRTRHIYTVNTDNVCTVRDTTADCRRRIRFGTEPTGPLLRSAFVFAGLVVR